MGPPLGPAPASQHAGTGFLAAPSSAAAQLRWAEPLRAKGEESSGDTIFQSGSGEGLIYREVDELAGPVAFDDVGIGLEGHFW